MPVRETIERLGKRRVCPKGHTYHLVSKPPKRKGICDVDGLPLAIRHDDTPTALRSRLAEHQKYTEPVLARFKKRGLLLEIDGRPSIRAVSQDILRRLPPFLAR